MAYSGFYPPLQIEFWRIWPREVIFLVVGFAGKITSLQQEQSPCNSPCEECSAKKWRGMLGRRDLTCVPQPTPCTQSPSAAGDSRRGLSQIWNRAFRMNRWTGLSHLKVTEKLIWQVSEGVLWHKWPSVAIIRKINFGTPVWDKLTKINCGFIKKTGNLTWPAVITVHFWKINFHSDLIACT